GQRGLRPHEKAKQCDDTITQHRWNRPYFRTNYGALFGPVAFLWIVLGSIFAGGVHDYLTGMISIRNKGAHIPELAGKFLGNFSKHVVNAFALLLLLLVGTVFATTSGSLLHVLVDGKIAL